MVRLLLYYSNIDSSFYRFLFMNVLGMKKICFTIVVSLWMLNCYGSNILSDALAQPLVDAQSSMGSSTFAMGEMSEEEKAEFFQKAFGKAIPTTFYPHDIIVILDRNISTPMEVTINPYTQEVHFTSKRLLEFLDEYLLHELLQEHFGEELPDIVDQEFLHLYGFQMSLDMKHQTIFLTSPIELREKTIISMRPQPLLNVLQPDENQPISGYVNTVQVVKHGADYNMYHSNYYANLNIRDWLVQSEMVHDNQFDGSKAKITGARIVTDWYAQQIRVTIGDTNSPNARLNIQKKTLASGFQQALVGIDATHTVGGIRNRVSDFSYMFLVEEDAKLEVEINGQIVYADLLFPGKYELQRLPFVQGQNAITIRLTGVHGIIEERKIEYFYNPTLLAKGQKEFRFVSGMPYANGSDMMDIDVSRYTNLAYWRQGVTDQIGVTGYMQTVRGNYLIGSIGEYGFANNISSLELVHSKNSLGPPGNSIRLQLYSSNSSSSIQKRSWKPNYYTVSFLYNSPYFDPILARDAGVFNNTRCMISPSVVWQVSSAFQVQFTATLKDSRDTVDATAFTLRSYYRSKRWLYTASVQKVTGPDPEFNFFTMATWRPKGNPRNRFTYRYDSISREHTTSANIWSESYASLNYFINSTVVDRTHHSQSIMVQQQDLGHTLISNISRTTNGAYHNDDYRVNYSGARAIMNLEHNRMVFPEAHVGTTSFMINTAVAFVGQHWGISRPISRSFALLYPNNEGLKASNIRFNNGSVLDKYSAAVYPILNNYQTTDISIDWKNTRNVPLGMELGEQKYTLQGRLNSGQAIAIGKPGGTIMATTILLKPNGDVLDLEVGTFTHVQYPDVEIQFFTNRNGKLYVIGLMPGEYEITILGNSYEKYSITIPKNAQSPFDLGTITLTKSTP